MSDSIFMVSIMTDGDLFKRKGDATFLVLAEGDREAEEKVRSALRKLIFSAKLKNSDLGGTTIAASDALANDSVVLLATGTIEDAFIGEPMLDSQMVTVPAVATTRLMVRCLKAVDNKTERLTLLDAVSEETGKTMTFRRHLRLVEDWLEKVDGTDPAS